MENANFEVTFWDGEVVQYGEKEPRIKIIFHKPLPLSLDLKDPILAMGEAYMEGIWDYEGELEEIFRMVDNNEHKFKPNGIAKNIGGLVKALNHSAEKLKQKENIQHHYDLGNDFFGLWLDETLSYSCAYFKSEKDTLYQAQINKIDHILKKLQLKPGERLLDIGCGWGWLIIRAAQQYQVKALGITLSSQQYEAVLQRIKEEQLEHLVDVKLISYLDLLNTDYRFEKIVSVGMFEHVGQGNLHKYMEKINELLVPGGLSLLHTITGLTEQPVNNWIKKYIFPGGYIPSLREIIWMLPEHRFHLLHTESLRMHYAKTLDHWYGNFSQWRDLIAEKMGEKFVRMWGLYLNGCAASFRVSGLDIYQFLFSKGLNNQLPLEYSYIYK